MDYRPKSYYNPSWLQRYVLDIIKQGSVPRHVGYIMDGNRRYAKSKGLPIMQGHTDGGVKMKKVLGWCKFLGVYAVTTFAFSLDNFGRAQEEVEGLIKVFEDAMTQYLEEIDFMIKDGIQFRVIGSLELFPQKLRVLAGELMEKTRHCNKHVYTVAMPYADFMIKDGIQFRVIGRLELFPQKLRVLAGELMERTRHCNKHVYTVAMPYAGRDDITYAINQLKEGVRKGLIEPDDVSEALMEQCLQTSDLPPVDMIVRTSGEMRFSNFMLWQCAYSVIAFDKVLWPNYDFWNFVGGMLMFQRHADQLKPYLKKLEDEGENYRCDEKKGQRVTNFLKYLDDKYTSHISNLKHSV